MDWSGIEPMPFLTLQMESWPGQKSKKRADSSSIERHLCGAGRHERVSPIQITWPDGAMVTSEQANLNQVFSKALNQEVQLMATEQGKVKGVQSSLPPSWMARSEEYWLDIDGRDYRESVPDFVLHVGTFFDAARVHLLTTTTLKQLHDGYPQGSLRCHDFDRITW